MWSSNWDGVCTKRCVIFRRCAAYRFWWDNWAIILIRSDLPLAFCSLTPACYFSVGRMGSLFRMSLKGESHRACLDGRVGSTYDFVVNVSEIREFDSSLTSWFLFALLWMEGALKCFAKFLKSFRKWHQWDNWMMTKKYFKWLIEFFNWIVLILWFDGFSGGESYEIQNFDDVREYEHKNEKCNAY